MLLVRTNMIEICKRTGSRRQQRIPEIMNSSLRHFFPVSGSIFVVRELPWRIDGPKPITVSLVLSKLSRNSPERCMVDQLPPPSIKHVTHFVVTPQVPPRKVPQGGHQDLHKAYHLKIITVCGHFLFS